MIKYIRLVPAYSLLLALLLPVYVVRWDYFGVLPTTLLELFIWILLFFWVAWRLSKKDFSIPRTRFDIPIVIILCASCLSIVVAGDHIAALGIARAYFWEPILVFYALSELSRMDHGDKIRKGILAGLVGAAIWMSLVGLVQYVLGFLIVTEHQADRAHAVFNNGNALALFLGPLICILFAWIIRRDQQNIIARSGSMYFKVALFSICVLLLTAFGFTQSLGGILAVGVLMVAIVASGYISSSHIFHSIVVGTFFISIAFLAFAPRFAPEVDNPWVRPGGTGQVRLCLWEGTAGLLADHWLMGTGLSGFKEVYSADYVTCDAEPVEYPHNFFMSVWVELGVLGLLGFLMLFKRLGQYIAVTDGAFIVWVSLGYWLVHGLVDVPYFKNDLAMMFWLLLAFIETTPQSGHHPRG